MKNCFKKFSIMFVMSLILMLGCCTSAFAADNGVVGIDNLNNTTGNSAKLDDVLELPEIGWKRYDDTDSKLLYMGNWTNNSPATPTYGAYYKGTRSIGNSNATLTFKYKGSKIRLLGDRWVNPTTLRTTNCKITVDGVEQKLPYLSESNDKSTYLVGGNLIFELLNLKDTIHTIEIVNNDTDLLPYVLDAIDIDDSGYLIDNNESILLDKSSLTLPVNTSQQLTATTTPAGAEVEWISDNTGIATVEQDGTIKGISVGTATITARIKGTDTIATCEVKVTDGGIIVDPPVDGDGKLFIELVDGNIKQYDVDDDEISKFIKWFKDRDNDDNESPIYKFTKGSYKDYVVHDKIDWFEVR